MGADAALRPTRMRAVCRNQTWFSKVADTVYKNANFNPESMRRARPFYAATDCGRGRVFSGAARLGIMPTVTTTPSARDKAAQDAAALVSYLRTVPSDAVITDLIDLGEHLERAIRAFHMEAIRFRAFTMSRLIKQHHETLPADVSVRMDAILQDLEAAGFQTRSVTA
ncbi:hypothetical protein LuPra_03567 [Luteitalea pratensis]|uniref:Uncharacterized protein n=1 Tax=Luteitalea pratensis TaxID=1855912 RepID=A0A143PNV1_LUTPR|nr:hypothetical protein LuPra_03567 [Luteitalea pratensis]